MLTQKSVKFFYCISNKTGLQPVSRPVEQIIGFYGSIYKKVQKMVQTYLKTLNENIFKICFERFGGMFCILGENSREVKWLFCR